MAGDLRLLGLFRRLRSRSSEEQGFTLIETIIAITIIFGSLLALAYTATIGFGYMGLARERQAANAIADKIKEDVRGLAYSKIQQGLSSSDLSGDPNIVTSCPGDPAGTYRFLSCTGEKIVNTAGLPNSCQSPNPPCPLVPHRGTISSGYPTTYSWAAYVTNNDPTTTPYRVTVIVSWTGGAVNGVAESLKTQSLYWSPSGCVSSSTHPYAAPCQPFFFGQAQVPRGAVTISGSIEGLSFSNAGVLTTGVESDGQQEQFVAVQGSYTQSGATLTDGSGQQTVGGTSATTAASDTDPGGTAPKYDPGTPLISGTGGSLTSSNGSTWITVSAPNGDSATSESATAAGGSSVCPPWTSAETDGQPCSGSKIQQGDSLSATVAFDGIEQGIGNATLATIGAAASNPDTTFPDTTFVDRVLVSGQDGRLANTVTRRFGTINLVGLPSGLTPSAPDPLGSFTYLVTLTSYADTATATVGTGAPAPTGSVTGGTISYWNGNGYSSVSANQTFTPAPVTLTMAVNERTFRLDITSTALTGATFTPTSTALSGTPAALGDADGTMTGPLTGTITYTITDLATQTVVVNLSIQIDLGTMVARGVYARAPSAG